MLVYRSAIGKNRNLKLFGMAFFTNLTSFHKDSSTGHLFLKLKHPVDSRNLQPWNLTNGYPKMMLWKMYLLLEKKRYFWLISYLCQFQGGYLFWRQGMQYTLFAISVHTRTKTITISKDLWFSFQKRNDDMRFISISQSYWRNPGGVWTFRFFLDFPKFMSLKTFNKKKTQTKAPKREIYSTQYGPKYVKKRWKFGDAWHISWVWPLPSNSDHQDYYIFSRESL